MFVSLMSGFALLGCPLFTEFLPDPVDTTDAYGEFIEIRLDSNFKKNDTLFIQFENNAEYPLTQISAPRLLLHRDTLACHSNEWLDCKPLPFSALPNSRTSFWALRSTNCSDSALLPIPKSGKSFQRDGLENDSWVYVTPTPGEANNQYESGIKDCEIKVKQVKYYEKKWHVQLLLSNCDSTSVQVTFFPLMYKNLEESKKYDLRDSLWVSSRLESPSFLFKAELPFDENSQNNLIDTLLFLQESPPIYFTEIHHCPEDIPEWIEVFNQVKRALPLIHLGFGRRGQIQASLKDSIYSQESLIITKDTSALIQAIGIEDLSIKRASLGYLKNTLDTLFLTYKNTVLDSVIWNKETKVQCPNGFNPRTNQIENTPGFQGRTSMNKSTSPFSFQINTRIISKKSDENTLRILIESEEDVLIELLSIHGKRLWQIKNKALNHNWIHIPLIQKGALGPNFIRISVGHYEKMVGVVLRP